MVGLIHAGGLPKGAVFATEAWCGARAVVGCAAKGAVQGVL